MTHQLAIYHLVLGRRQGSDRFGEHLVTQHQHADLTRAGAHHGSIHLQEIAQVEVQAEALHSLFAQFVYPHKHLQATRTVFNMREHQLAHQAHRAQPAGQTNRHRFRRGALCHLLGRFKSLYGFRNGMSNTGSRGIGLNAVSAHALYFFNTNFFEIRKFHRFLPYRFKQKPRPLEPGVDGTMLSIGRG